MLRIITPVALDALRLTSSPAYKSFSNYFSVELLKNAKQKTATTTKVNKTKIFFITNTFRFLVIKNTPLLVFGKNVNFLKAFQNIRLFLNLSTEFTKRKLRKIYKFNNLKYFVLKNQVFMIQQINYL